MNVDEASDFLIPAASHLLTAELIVKHEGERAFNGQMSASFFLLAGNSLELTLKAAFVCLGGTTTLARTKIGHRLDLALEAVIEAGYPHYDGDLVVLVDNLADPHKRHYFRYLGGDGKFILPTPDYAVSVIRRHITNVGQMIGPQFFKT